jgi:hypothetical protein
VAKSNGWGRNPVGAQGRGQGRWRVHQWWLSWVVGALGGEMQRLGQKSGGCTREYLNHWVKKQLTRFFFKVGYDLDLYLAKNIKQKTSD